jgi:glutathione S-transferase
MSVTSPPGRLLTISYSHYCDKARWALERAGIAYRESAHLPVFHAPAVRRAGGKRGTPTLVTDEGVLGDSSDILAWVDRQRPTVALFGKDAADRAEILRLEELFDEELGPHTRRWAYFQILPHRRLMLEFCGAQTDTPRLERALLPVFFPVARLIMRKAMRIDAAGAALSLARIDEVFAQVDALLADGRPFLVGDSLTAADITFAALAAPALLPEPAERLPGIERLTAPAAEQVRRWRARAAGAFAMKLVREHRRA